MFNPRRLTSGYALIWPRELFRDELTAITDWLEDRDQRSAIDLLFEEALRGPHPGEDLADIDDGPTAVFDPWTPAPHPSDEEPPENHCRTFGRYVLANADDLPVYTPRRYYLWRNRPTEEADGPETTDWLTLQRAWTTIVEDLVRRGYLDRRAGDACEDGRENEQPSRINQLILDNCELGDQWPLALVEEGYATDQDYFFTLVEVFHDLVARPRVRDWHGHDEHYRYSDFDDEAGQAVYRWKVNQLLDQHNVDLQVTETGEDRGLLVHSPRDPRRELVEQVRAAPDGNVSRIDHAIALFRKRDATAEDKRSACAALSNVLEDRRKTVLKKQLVKDDEGPLFQIANTYAIRHHRDDQMYGYDEAFLDWIFWWYLATIELTNRLIARDEATGD